MGTFRGYRMDVFSEAQTWWLDHTWVAGYRTYPCFGRYSGGEIVPYSTIYIKSSKVHCLSHMWMPFPNDMGWTNTSGLIYLANGVCHQMANRLLVSRGASVMAADGAILSSIIYGPFGNTWAVWAATRLWMCLVWGSPPFHEPKGRGKHKKYMERVFASYNEKALKIVEIIDKDPQKKERIEKIRASFSKAQSEIPEHVIMGGRPTERIMRSASNLYAELARKTQEIATMDPFFSEDEAEKTIVEDAKSIIEYRLGTDYDPDKIKGILGRRAEFAKEKHGMDKGLLSPKRIAKGAALEVNERFRKFQEQIQKEIGRDDYEKLFGKPPEIKYRLGDPEAAGVEE